ncbi:MAG: tandem-95 repeat protein, partial [Fuerstiella sp.]|nr:tandem-95 repeat protein [Fuerstiella sp.]
CFFSDAGADTATFNYTGGQQTWTVPAGVTSVTIEAWGASGWSGANSGGLGGHAKGNLAVTPGETLYIYVGGQGTVASTANTPMGGGFNGGGHGQANTSVNSAGGGGGASDVRKSGIALTDRVIVAAGGGGSTNNSGCFGGGGGGLTGLDGGGTSKGTGGTQSAGGTTGGALGQGGNAAVAMTPWNGGGGGGYYGGGVSPAHHGGGGGSSYIGGVTGGLTSSSVRSGNGSVVITYVIISNIPPTITSVSNQTTDEDSVTSAISFTIGDAETPAGSLSLSGSSTDTALVPNGNIVFGGSGSGRTVTVTPDANRFGSADITVTVIDSGTPVMSVSTTFTLTVSGVNDQPSFTASDQTVNEDAGAQSISGWAAFNPGNAFESSQAAAYTVSNISNPSLFSVAPAVSSADTLTFTPAPDISGSSTFDIQVQDNGGTANGGTDTSSVQTFTIAVNPANDAPSFTKGPDQTVNENAGSQAVAGWVTAMSTGPSDESGQSFTAFNATNDNNPLFSVQPSVDPSTGDLTYTTAADMNGSATVAVTLSDDGGTANGGADTSANQTFTITVTAVNDAPSFIKGADQTVNEDAGAQGVAGWATAFSRGPADESGQTLTISVSNNNNALFSAQPSVDAGTGDLTYTPAANMNGSATVTVTLSDDGGTANGGTDNSFQAFTITVNPVNDIPSFTKGANQTVNEDAGTQSVAGWATAILKGPANESGQSLTFNLTNTNNTLFSVQPWVSAGDLTYTPAADMNGSATVTVSLSDDGGTANGGTDTSANQTFTITVTAVNDAPSATIGTDQTVNEDAGAQGVPGWATAFSTGPANESGQALALNVTNNSNSLFSAQPAVDTATGTLTYTPAADMNGTATVTLTLSDNGGAAGGGSDTSVQTFTVTVNAVNDAPLFSKGTDQTVNEDAGAQNIPGWATAISKGPADESGQTLAFSITDNTNTSLFSVQPAVSVSGDLAYTPAPDMNGSATVTLSLSDSGGTAYGGSDSSGAQTFAITVNPVNDAPVITGQNSVSTPEETSLAIGLHHMNVTDIDNSYPAGFGLIVLDGANYTRSGITVTPVLNFNGTITVPVKVNDGAADSNGLNLSIAVTPVDDGPVPANAIADVTVNEDSADTSIGLGNVFTDIDNDVSAISKSVISNSNPGMVSATVTGNTLTLDFQPNMNGAASVTIRGTSNGKTADDTFTITVNATDDALFAANPIADVTANEDSADTAIGLGSVFTDIDNDVSAITKSVLSNSNPGLVSASVSGNTLTLDYQPDMNGTASVAVRGTSNGKTADDTFTVTVNATDDALTVAIPIADVTADEDTADTGINLGAVFTDIDNDDGAIAKAVQSNSNPGLVSATVSGNTLTLDYQPDMNGTALITIRGTSNGKTADDTFTVTVNATDDALTVATPIADVTADEDASDTGIDLGAVFTDIDNDDNAIAKSVVSNTSQSLVSASVSGNTLTLDYQENQNGTTVVTVRGTS